MSTSEVFVAQISDSEVLFSCKAFQSSTRRRVVWMAALHWVCLDNALFLSSIPLFDLSDLELEKSAMAPSRWIQLCDAFKQPEDLNQHGGILRPQATRIIHGSFGTEVDYGATKFFLVPGGRYLLSYSRDIISVLHLGYTSSADCKLVASVKPKGGCNIRVCRAQATPDGMGLTIFRLMRKSTPIWSLIILVYGEFFFFRNSFSVYEIYLKVKCLI